MAVAELEPTPLTTPVPRTWMAVVQEWLTTVDHKKIGILYFWTAVFFLIVAGCEALVIRFQLFWPGEKLVSPDVFNQLFTLHGATMIFFMAMPILIGTGNYLVPLQIGARDMAFPR